MAAPIVLGITIRATGSTQVNSELNQVRSGLNSADSAAQNANRSFAAMARETLGLGNALKGLAAGLSVLAIYQSTKEIIMLADKITLLDSRIKIATASQADYLSSSKELVAISLRTGTSFEANATIFSRINKAMEQMGGTTRNTTALTETLAQSLRISGASAGEAASVIRQMSQALASGVLRGDEFNSLMENSPRLSQALADGMHVSIGALRAMAEAGELTSKRVIEAIQSQSAVINDEFAKVPLTVGAAMENISTAFGQYVLEANKGAGATEGLAQHINDLAKNLTPVIDGIVTLGKITVAVFAMQMVKGIMSYITALSLARAATAEAATVEAAHTAAIAQNMQVNIARAEATVAATASITAFRTAQESLSIADTRAVETALLSINASISRTRATIAATSATIQSTSVIYLNRQATQALAIAEQERLAILVELYAVSGRQTVAMEQLALATVAAEEAVVALGVAEVAAIAPSTSLAASLWAMLTPMNLLNIGFALWIGWQIGTWLNSFTAVANQASYAMGEWAKKFETLSYWSKLFTTDITDTSAITALTAEHQKNIAVIDGITDSTIAYRNAVSAANEGTGKGAALSGEMAAAIESLKTPQEVYNQRIKEATEASKTLDSEAQKLDATSKKMLITEEQRLALGAKALELWQQANAAEQSAKLSEAGKELVKLQEQYDKLSMSVEDYNKQQAQALKGLPEEKAEVERLNNAILGLTDSKAALAKEEKEQEAAKKKAADASDAHNKKILELLQSLSAEHDIDMLSGKDKELQIALRKNLKDAIGEERVEIELITKQIFAENEARRIQQAMWDESISQANALDKLKDDSRYAVELANMARALQAQGFSNAAIKEQIDLEKQKRAAIEANFNLPERLVSDYTTTQTSAEQQLSALTNPGGNMPARGSGIIQKETTETARVALEAYNKTLDDAKTKTSDLGAVTSAIFDGALGGINTMAGAFDNMVNSIDKTSLALDENARMQKLNEKTVDPAAKAANTAKYAQEEIDLNSKILSEKLAGTRQIAGAVSSMLTKGSTAQRAAHAIEMGIAGAQMAQTVIKLLGIGAVTAAEVASVGPEVAATMAKGTAKAAEAVATQASAGPYIGFALMAAMAVAMAAIGFGVGGGSSSTAPPPRPTSPDTGTVLGDSSAKSESIDKTYDLLKSIHADEYKELRGINSGVAGLKTGVTSTIDKLFQAGGLATPNAPADTRVTSIYEKAVGGAIGVASLIASGPMSIIFANIDRITGSLGKLLHISSTASTAIVALATAGLSLVYSKIINPIFSWVGNLLFGGKQTSKVTGQGLSTNPTSLGSIVDGGNLGVQQYTNIETKTQGGWFTSNKYSNSTQYQAVDAATQTAMNQVFKSMGVTMIGLADALGNGVAERVKNYIIPAMTIELKGLSGEDAAKKLNAVISTALDTMSTAVFGDIVGQYQKLGEGMLETAVRIVAEVAVVKDALATSGLSLATNAIAISDALIQAAGGIEEFQKSFESYYDKFYNDTEKTARIYTSMSSALDEVGLSVATTRAGYRAQIEALNMSNPLDQERYTLLIKLSGAADTYYTALEDGAASAASVAKTQRSMDIKYMELTGNAIGALTATRQDEINALDESLRLTQIGIYALTDANQAIATATTTAMNTVNAALATATTAVSSAATVLTAAMNTVMTKATTAVSDAVNVVSKSISNLSALSAKLRGAITSTDVTEGAATKADRQGAQKILDAALRTVKKGGSIDNFAGLDKAITNISKPSQQLYTNATDYARDQGRASSAMSQIADSIDTKVSDAQKQVDAINGVSTSIVTLSTAITKLTTANGNLIAATDQQKIVNKILGIDTSVVTVAKAVADLATAQGKLIAATDQQKIINKILGIDTSIVTLSTAIANYKTAQKDLATVQDQKTQINKLLGIDTSVLTVAQAIFALAAALKVKDKIIDAIAIATTAQGKANIAEGKYNSAVTKYGKSSGAVTKAKATATAAHTTATTAQAAVPLLKARAAADAADPVTAYLRDNPGVAAHAAVVGVQFAWQHYDRFGRNEGRAWGGDQLLVQAGTAQTEADRLLGVANALDKLIPGLEKIAGIDKTALGVALAAFNTATGLATKAKNAIPKVPGFASGGDHAGGYRIVGENGPELESTGPSRIFNNSQTKSLLSMDELIAEIKSLRADVRAGQAVIADNTRKTAVILRDVTQGGTAMNTVVTA